MYASGLSTGESGRMGLTDRSSLPCRRHMAGVARGEGFAYQREEGSASCEDDFGAGGAGEKAGHSREFVMWRLEEAGATLLSLPASGPRTACKTSRWPVVHTAIESYGWSGARLRPAVPEPARITRMDEALGWIEAIPRENYVLRRIVGARALVSPLTGRHLFPWRKLGVLLGADARAVRRWHDKGIDLIREWLAAQAKP